MVGFNIFASLDVGARSANEGNPGSPSNLVIRALTSDEPSALASVGSSILEAIPESENEDSSSDSKKRGRLNLSIEVPDAPRSSQDDDYERDYDVNPTRLYSLLQSRSWEEAINRIEHFPNETKIWIFRKESGSDYLRWRLLPLHASIIFKAPIEVIESIITVYPEAARECDDQQSLPIHLAYKRGASASTFRVLLECYPECVDIEDAKGRTPRDLVRKATGPRHVEFVYALKVHLAGRQVAREEARIEEEEKFNVKLEDARMAHEAKLLQVKEQSKLQIELLETKIKSLEQDLDISQSVSKTLNENITLLQSQLKQQQETESSLAKQLAERDCEIEESRRNKTMSEDNLEKELSRLASQIASLKQEINKLLLEKEILDKSLESVVESTEWEKRKLEKKIDEQRKTIEALKVATKRSEAEKQELKVELHKKEIKERDLSETIENLEIQLRYKKSNDSETVLAAQSKIESLQSERDLLKDSNSKMSNQLESVATLLVEMKEEQIGIVDQASEHEKQMEIVTSEHARILKEIKEQQKRDLEAQQSRYLFAAIVRAQEEEMARNVRARQMIQDAIALQSERIQAASDQRSNLVESAEKVSREVEQKLKGFTRSIPNLSERMTEDEESLHHVAECSHASFYWSQSSTGVASDDGEEPQKAGRLEQ